MTASKSQQDVRLEPYVEEILEKRYYLPGENWAAICERVSTALFGEKGMEKQRKEAFDTFFHRRAIMASPTLMNAGGRLGMLSSCFIYPIHDSLKSIMATLSLTAETFKMGGGVGIDFSTLRPAGTIIKKTGGVSTGPVSFMGNYDWTGKSVSGGGLRKAAQIGVLRAEHPDIWAFIKAKSEAQRVGDGTHLSSMNLSVAAPDALFSLADLERSSPEEWFTCVDDKTGAVVPNAWRRAIGGGEKKAELSERGPEKMREQYGEMAVRQGKEGLWQLHWGGTIHDVVSAQEVLRSIAEEAWEAGCPGVIFIDQVNRRNFVNNVGFIRNPNPCVCGDTKIAVADGRGCVAISALAAEERECQIYTVGLDGKLAITMGVKPRLTKQNAETVWVRLDGGSALRVTPDHVFPLQNGDEKRADQLLPGDRLHHLTMRRMTLGQAYRRFGNERSKHASGRGLYQFADLNGDGFIAEHRLVARDLLGANIVLNFIHHRDHNALNNVVDNLEPMLPAEHRRLHAENMRGDQNPYHRCFDVEMRLRFAKHSGRSNGRFRECSDEDLREHALFILRRYGVVSGGSWNLWVARRGIQDKVPFCQSYEPFKIQGTTLPELVQRLTTADERQLYATSVRSCRRCGSDFAVPRNSLVMYCSEGCRREQIREQTLSAKRRYREKLRAQKLVSNYRVASVESAERCDVYNLTADETHVFFAVVEENGDGSLGSVGVRNCGEFYAPLPGVDEYNDEPMGLPPFDNGGPTCNLGSINLDVHVRPVVGSGEKWDWEVDMEALEKTTRLMVRSLDRVVDVNRLPTLESTVLTQLIRPIGLGVFGLANVLIRLGLRYDSDEGRSMASELLERVTFWSMDESVNLAIEARKRGVFIGRFDQDKLKAAHLEWKGAHEKKGEPPSEDQSIWEAFSGRSLGDMYEPCMWTPENVFSPWGDDDPLRGSFPAIYGSRWDFSGLELDDLKADTTSRQAAVELFKRGGFLFAAGVIECGRVSMDSWLGLFRRIKKEGIRHCHTTFLMPTGTTSFICNCTESSGIEPLYQLTPFKRKHAETTSTGGTIYVQRRYYPQVVLDYAERVLDLDRNKVLNGEVEIPLKSLPPYFVAAFTMKPDDHVLMQAVCQRVVHNGISKTCNLPESATVEEVLGVYRDARRLGCYGVTIYRHHSKSEQIYDQMEIDEGRRILPKPTPKLPLSDKESSAVFRIQDPAIDGGKVFVTVTLLDGKWPIEIFLNFDAGIPEKFLEVVKSRNLTARFISNLLRRGVSAEEIVRNLEKCSRGNDFHHQLANRFRGLLADAHRDDPNEVLPERTLNVIRPRCPTEDCKGRLVLEGGCYKCPECGYSVCG